MRGNLASRPWIILTAFGVLAAVLYLLSVLLTMPDEAHSLVQAVAEALVGVDRRGPRRRAAAAAAFW